jgi:hypothetical protein
VVSAIVLTAAINQPARSDPIWNVGASMNVNGTNAPNSFTQNIPLTIGPVLIDLGVLSLTTSIVNVPGGAEWLIFHFATTNTAPIVGNTNGSWQLQALPQLSAPANGLGFYFDWSSNGTLLTPTSSFGGASPGTNPVTGSGTVFVNSTFCPFLTCGYINTANNTVNFFAFTSDYALAPGNNGSTFLTANDFEIGIEMQLVNPVPLPTALPLFATGLGAMGLLGWRRKRKAQAVA